MVGRRSVWTYRHERRRIRYAVENKDEARKLVRRSLRCRTTARKRIGVSYRFRELIDSNGWCPSSFSRSSAAESVAARSSKAFSNTFLQRQRRR
jgi:hypothetical protein